jgi:hypothetical protein
MQNKSSDLKSDLPIEADEDSVVNYWTEIDHQVISLSRSEATERRDAICGRKRSTFEEGK